jgi:hypothetical protein
MQQKIPDIGILILTKLRLRLRRRKAPGELFPVKVKKALKKV